ncbi:EAL domain-containing protein [Piscinibacter sakaiensis]|uniref:sensor domain-containing protein n=1 Tax=Piscinibacter sakaiensis TaxID=1547922 RepID=UPI003AAA83E5
MARNGRDNLDESFPMAKAADKTSAVGRDGWPSRLRALLPGRLRQRKQPIEAVGPTCDHRFEQLFEHAGEALLLCSRNGTVLACNPPAARLCGRPAAAVVGRNMLQFLKTGNSQSAAGQPETLPGESLLKGGTDVWQRVKVKVTPMLHDGTAQRLLHLLPVAAEPSRANSQLHQLANFDSLTGLANRALFRDRLSQAMARAKRSGEPMALMFLDLDRFKIVNDSLGHEVGDQLLVHVANQLKHCLRTVDSVLRCGGDDQLSTLSRLGGDEFTVIAEAVGNAERAGLVAQRLLEALAIPFVCGEEEIVIGASVGISLYPTDDVDLDGLIRHTDMAMYRSKSLGRGIFTFYSDDLNEAVATRLSFEGSLRHAVERKEFLLHYQPKVDLHSGKVTGVEALLRWNCPMKGMIRPDRFITVLEETGMIVPVGAWVIRAACAEMARWDRLGLPPLRMAVNMSARQFRHQHLIKLIEDTLREHEIEPGRLEIELTETLLMEDNEANRNMFANFARIGVRLAIDDFGTGHSSLAYLKRFNIDTLKIDRSFISALPDDADDAAIARAVIAMGHSMRMSVVAEGVETQAQADFLRGLGCDEIQGYLLSRPLPGPELVDWLRAHETVRAKAQRAVGGNSAPMPLMTLWESKAAA